MSRTQIKEELRAIADDAEARQRGDFTLTLYQQRPWTMVDVSVVYKGKRYGSLGFSKVNWPDEFRTDEGTRVALGHALGRIAKEIEKER